MRTVPFDGRWTLALGLALVSAGCGTSDDVLAPNSGRVRFVIDAVAGIEPFAASSETGAPVEVGPDGLYRTSGGDSGPGSGDGGDSSGHDGTDNSGPGNGEDGTVHPDRPEVYPPPPHVRIKSANVTFASILARNLDGVLVDVEMDLPVTVDVLTLSTGREIQLPEGELPEGTYDEAVVVVTEVEVTLWDDTVVTVAPPGGGWTAVVALCPPVEVEEGGTTTVSLTLELHNAILFTGDRFHFRPIFKPHFMCRGDEIPPPLPMEPAIP